MTRANPFRDKLRRGELCLGVGVTFTDATATEALCNVFDFVWIDMEHNALSLEAVQAHIMATNGSATTPLVRVAWNDPVLIKPVLDIGAAGVIAPMVRSAAEARRLVAACRYPPEGIRGFGPRRAAGYGRRGGPEFCREENESVLAIAQIEHLDGVNDLDAILAMPGLTSIVIGPADLACSMGHPGNPHHPEVRAAIETIVAKARRTTVFVGIGLAEDPLPHREWVAKGVQWCQMGSDYSLMLRAAAEIVGQLRPERHGDRS